MARVAALIGISEYGPGFRPLPAAVHDVEMLKQVLCDRNLGQFDEVQLLLNVSCTDLAGAIETWVSSHQAGDVALLYFSGYWITDSRGRFYLAARDTHLNDENQLIKASAVSFSFLQECLEQSCAEQKLLIFDWCCGESLEQAAQGGDRTLPLESLSCNGWGVLSSTTGQFNYSCLHKRHEQSLYSQYLTEGILWGNADRDQDGRISAADLHQFLTAQLHIAAPGVQLGGLGLEQSPAFAIARTNVNDPHQRYRWEVEQSAGETQISPVRRTFLEILRGRLGLSLEEAKTIEEEVRQPYRDYLYSLDRYRDAAASIEQEYLLNEDVHRRLELLQQILGLREEDVITIRRAIADRVDAYQRELTQRARLNDLEQYRAAYIEAAKQQFPIPAALIDELAKLQQLLHLADGDIKPIHEEINARYKTQIENHRLRLQRYERELEQAIQGTQPISDYVREGLKRFQANLQLTDDEAEQIEQRILNRRKRKAAEEYAESLRRYEETVQQAIAKDYTISPETRQTLRNLQQTLNVRDEDATRIEEEALAQVSNGKESYQQRLQRYRTELDEILAIENPPGGFARHRLKRLQQSLELSDSEVEALYRSVQSGNGSGNGYGNGLGNDRGNGYGGNGYGGNGYGGNGYGGNEFGEGGTGGIVIPPGLMDGAIGDAPVPPAEPPLPPQTAMPSVEQFIGEAFRPPNGNSGAGSSADSLVDLPQTEPIASQVDHSPMSQPAAAEAVTAGVDYTYLRELLSQQRWKQADEETLLLLLRSVGKSWGAGRPNFSVWLDRTAIDQLPLDVLDAIDRLWAEHSGGKLGFRAQLATFRSLPRSTSKAFAEQVGWWNRIGRIYLPYSNLQFNPQAPVGHLPAAWYWHIPPGEAFNCWGLLGGRGGCGSDPWMLFAMMSRVEQIG